MQWKYRVWDVESKKMYYPSDLGDGGNNLTPYGKLVRYYEEIRDVVETRGIPLLWTGLKDKSGKEIYQGDIIELKYKGRWVVEWDNGSAGFFPFNFSYNAPDAETEREVIGNKFENPELITEGK